MKKSIILTILFLLPIVILTVSIEAMLRRIPSEYFIKSEFMDTNASKIEILVLGSSHGITAIDPDYFSLDGYNCAHYAQSLDIDHNILSKYKNELSSLKYIILPVSYHSLWTNLEQHSHKWRRKYYNIYYKINEEKNPLKRFIIQDESMSENLNILKEYYLDKKDIDLNITKLGLATTPSQTNLQWIKSVSEDVVDAQSTSDLTRLYDENVSYLKGVIEIAKEKNAKVIFITTPGHQSFIEKLHPDQLNLLYTTMNSLKDDKDVFYFNFLHEFADDNEANSLKYFHDPDHLSALGAITFSPKLDSIINTIEKSKTNNIN